MEIGGGTGLNLPYYPDDLDELVLAEPDRPMQVRLERRLRRSDRLRARVVEAPAESLPFADGSVDTVVSTFVLCTVEIPEVALREIVRVLRPDGQFLFLEHVRSRSKRLASWQDRLAGRGVASPEAVVAIATAELIASSGLVLDDVHDESWRAMPPIVRPLIAGHARIGGTNE